MLLIIFVIVIFIGETVITESIQRCRAITQSIYHLLVIFFRIKYMWTATVGMILMDSETRARLGVITIVVIPMIAKMLMIYLLLLVSLRSCVKTI